MLFINTKVMPSTIIKYANFLFLKYSYSHLNPQAREELTSMIIRLSFSNSR